MHEGTQLMRARDHLSYGLDRPNLVVGEPDRDERSTGWDRICIRSRILVDACNFDGLPLRLQLADCGKHRLVFCRPGDDGTALGQLSDAEECEVDSLCAR